MSSHAEIAASKTRLAVRRTLGVLAVAILAAGAVAILFASGRGEGAGGDRPTTGYALGVTAKHGECVLVEFLNVGGVGRPGPQTPLAAVKLIRPGERGLVERRVARDVVVLERFEAGQKVAAYETHLLDGFTPTAWMVTRAERSLPCDVAKNAGRAPEVPPIDRPDERPSR